MRHRKILNSEAQEQKRLQAMCAYEKPYWDKGLYVAGMDEAGRGPLAGPCVAAAVIMPPGCLIPGVDDSKKLSEKKRQALYALITSAAVAYAVGIVDNRVVDEINILNAAKRAFAEAYRGLEVMPAFVFCDKIGGIDIGTDYQEIVGGDRLCYSVAAASIVAKVTRDEMMRQYALLYPLYGFEQHKGYGTQSHRECIIRYGVCDIHRMSFLKKIIS
ncbi:MAG: ribonuclease HII [Eubacteriales bacterium]|nr:ribonuclease HII [Eubacteriales bacterium]